MVYLLVRYLALETEYWRELLRVKSYIVQEDNIDEEKKEVRLLLTRKKRKRRKSSTTTHPESLQKKTKK
jgi:hypothetical protein